MSLVCYSRHLAVSQCASGNAITNSARVSPLHFSATSSSDIGFLLHKMVHSSPEIFQRAYIYPSGCFCSNVSLIQTVGDSPDTTCLCSGASSNISSLTLNPAIPVREKRMTKPGFEPGTSPYLVRAYYHYTTRPFSWRNHQLQQSHVARSAFSSGIEGSEGGTVVRQGWRRRAEEKYGKGRAQEIYIGPP